MTHDMMMRSVDILFRLFELVIIPLLALVIARYVKDSRIRGALSVLNDQALLAVQRLNKTRRELKDPSKPGVWTDEEASSLRDAARREVRQALGDSLNILIDQYGSALKVDKLIENAVDAHAESTRGAASAETSASNPPAPSPVEPPAPPAEPTARLSTLPPALPSSEPTPPSIEPATSSGDSNG